MDYAKHYERLIERARLRPPPLGYIEWHHVVPRCMGGSGDPGNLVPLTAEEHYVAHQLLVKMNPGKYRLVYAAYAMAMGNGKHGRVGNKLYGWLRRRLPEELDAAHKAKLSASKKGKTPLAERNAEIERLYKGGMKQTEIADRYGVTPPTIHNVLADRGVIRRGMSGCDGKYRRGYTANDVARLAATLSVKK